MAEKPKEDTKKMTKKFSPFNDNGELDLGRAVAYVLVLILGSYGVGVQTGQPSVDKYHEDAMKALRENTAVQREILDEARQQNENLRAMQKSLDVHESSAEKREERIMKKLDEVHRDIKK